MPEKDLKKSNTKSKDSKTKSIKYADKSAGQPQLLPIFNKIKSLMKHYEKDNFKPGDENPGSYSIYCIAPIEIAGRKYDEMCFASLLIQKGYVGFYFFPIYPNPLLAKFLGKNLMKCLKGKTCFYIKNNDVQVMNEIEAALQMGYEFYLKQGWK